MFVCASSDMWLPLGKHAGDRFHYGNLGNNSLIMAGRVRTLIFHYSSLMHDLGY